jgi:anti-sigma regulatory factor (Ser/Thr protein kinase)
VHAHRATCFHAFTGLNVAQLTNSEDHASGGCGLFWMQGTVREFVWW